MPLWIESPQCPRFFFDTRDNGGHVRDELGCELVGMDAVRDLAVRTLIEIAADEGSNSDQHRFGIDVRDEAGEAVLTSELTLETRRLG